MYDQGFELLSVRKLFYLVILLITSCTAVAPQVTSTPKTILSPTKPIILSSTSSPTKPIIPSSTSSPASIFSLDTANKTLPSDILNEVSFSPAGGGPGCDVVPASPNGLYEAATPENGELMDAAVMLICGWQVNEIVQVTVRFPNGEEIKKDLIALSEYENEPEILYWFIPEIGDPVGIYTFTFEGSSKKLTYSASYKLPDGPHVYPILLGSEQAWWDVLENTLKTINISGILVYEFTPNENIRLFAYNYGKNGKLEFLAWQEYQVDPTGQLFIRSDIKADRIIAVGELSGEVPLSIYSPFGPLHSPSTTILSLQNPGRSNQNPSCPGAPPQRVSVNTQAMVCTKNDKLIIREEPKRSSSEVDRIAPGTIIYIIDGPGCSDNWSWWKIQLGGELIGWVSEGGDSTDPYFICPVE